eukprot:scaffold1434_cov107-Cylindrotheca_fusiformis.AAC.1
MWQPRIVAFSSTLVCFLLLWDRSNGFLTPPQLTSHCRSTSVISFSLEDPYNSNNNPDVQEEILFGMPMAGFMADSELHKSLQERRMALHDGVGKRYKVRIPPEVRQQSGGGFLNVHLEPTDAFDTENVVAQLKEGQVVTSIGQTRGIWVPHDAGGWSVANFQGFDWLEPLDE